MGNLSSSAVQAQTRKARQFPRSPVLFASIQLGKNLQGFILNASEGGVCVQTAKEIVGDEPLDLRFQSVRPGGWVQARGRVVWKNETNTVAGLQFVDNNQEIAGEVRNWLSFGESLQELRGNWWPDTPGLENPALGAHAAFNAFPIDSPAPNPPRTEAPRAAEPVPAPPRVDVVPVLSAPLPPAAEEFAPLPAPPLPSLHMDEENKIEQTREPEQPHEDDATQLRRDLPIQFVPKAPESLGAPEEPEPPFEFEDEKNDVHVAPVPISKGERYTYDYVRPDSGEEHKGKFAIIAAGGACLLFLLIWFAFGHRNSSTAQRREVASSGSSTAVPPQAAVSAAAKPTIPSATSTGDVSHAKATASPAAGSHAPNTKSVAPVSQQPAKVAPALASAPKPKPAASPTQPAPAGNSGLVIQVGAMAEEANATKLATALTMQHFPAFVAKHTTDRFYRVLVGPFPSAAALRETELNLQKNGYQTLEKRWAP